VPANGPNQVILIWIKGSLLNIALFRKNMAPMERCS
jgi:hypothetical protein